MAGGREPPLFAPAAPPKRVVLLGASNLTRGLGAVARVAEHVLGTPLEILAAAGHGRSYGMRSRVLGRSLDGILQCGLWRALAESGERPAAALLTDIGNDIAYGAPAATILQWIEQCVECLATDGTRIVLTQLPIESVGSISRWRYELLRRFLFPSSRVQWQEAMRQVATLEAGLIELAARRKLLTVRPEPHWYGIDPVHIRRRHTRTAWSAILSQWSDALEEYSVPAGAPHCWGFFRFRPERQTRFGTEQRTPQPCIRLKTGTTIALY